MIDQIYRQWIGIQNWLTNCLDILDNKNGLQNVKTLSWIINGRDNEWVKTLSMVLEIYQWTYNWCKT